MSKQSESQLNATAVKAVETDNTEKGTEQEEGIHVSLRPEVLGSIGPMPVTNSMLAAYSVSIFLIILTFIATRKLKTVPGKLQLFLETVIMGAYMFMQNTTHNEQLTKHFFPIFMTLIMFFWTANMANFIPGLLALEYNGVHLYRPALADYALVVGLALSMFIFSQYTVMRFAGFKIYIQRYINLKSPIGFFVGILEFIGDCARILSLSFRLFGNIFSEEVLMLVMLSLAPFLAPVPFAMLGLLTSTIQAILFPMLVLLFLSITMEEAQHAESEAHAKHHPVPLHNPI